MRRIICNWLLKKAQQYIDAASYWSQNPAGTIGFEWGGLYLIWGKLFYKLSEAFWKVE